MDEPVKLGSTDMALVHQQASEVAWLDEFTVKMSEATAEEREFFAERRRLGLGVGLDVGGKLVYAKDDVTA